jgi:hypothetical protein
MRQRYEYFRISQIFFKLFLGYLYGNMKNHGTTPEGYDEKATLGSPK